MITIDQKTLSSLACAERAELELSGLGCTLSPTHDRLWLVPPGKMRAARRISRDNRYPAAFRAAGWERYNCTMTTGRLGYPMDWPKCACGEPTLDGHRTCGRAECGNP